MIKELEGRVEILTKEAAQAKFSTRTFVLEQVFQGSLTLELTKKELDTMVAL